MHGSETSAAVAAQAPTVDPRTTFEGYSVVRDDNPVKAAQYAFNSAINAAIKAKRLPTMVRVTIHVAPVDG